jgi:hypothetical protein
VNTYDPADSIVYVHMALDSTRTHSRLPAAGAEVSTASSGGIVATDHDRPWPAGGRSGDQIS